VSTKQKTGKYFADRDKKGKVGVMETMTNPTGKESLSFVGGGKKRKGFRGVGAGVEGKRSSLEGISHKETFNGKKSSRARSRTKGSLKRKQLPK